MKKVKTVTAAIMEKDGKYLIARRKDGEAQEGKWEFPGGKLIPGETLEKCLERELEEEFTIKSRTGDFFDRNFHEYNTGVIELVAFYSEFIEGEFIPVVHSEIRWVEPKDILNFDLSPADIPIAEKLAGKFSSDLQNAEEAY